MSHSTQNKSDFKKNYALLQFGIFNWFLINLNVRYCWLPRASTLGGQVKFRVWCCVYSTNRGEVVENNCELWPTDSPGNPKIKTKVKCDEWQVDERREKIETACEIAKTLPQLKGQTQYSKLDVIHGWVRTLKRSEICETESDNENWLNDTEVRP